MKESFDFGALVENTIEENNKVLYNLEAVKKSILNSRLPTFICQVDKNSPNYLVIIELNSHLAKITGFSKKELLGKDYDFLFDQASLDHNSRNSRENAKLIMAIRDFTPCSINLVIRSKNLKQKKKYKIVYNPIKTNFGDFAVFTLEQSKARIDEEIDEENKSLVKYLEKSAANEATAREIGYLMIQDENITRVSKRIANKLREYFKADRCIIHDYRSNQTTFVVEDCNIYSKSFLKNNEDGLEDITTYINFQNHFYSRFKGERKNSFIAFSHDNIGDIELKPIHEVSKKYSIASQITATIVFNHQVNGGIYLHFSEKRDWPIDEVELLEMIADHYSVAIDRWFSIEKVMIVNKELIEKTLELKESLKKEKHLREMQSEFVALVSHEFKTPLQLIDSTREVIIRKIKSLGISDESLDKNFTKIQNGIARINNLIQSTLNLSKIEMSEGKVVAQKNNFDLIALIKEIVEKNSNLSTQKNLQIEMEIESLPRIFYGDQKMLDHCFTNIITNAFKYSKENTKVTINSKIEGNQNLSIIISDQGIGIPKDDLQKIGQKFFRASNTLSVAGTGIGIYLTKYFVELHEGSVLIESEINVGTTVKVTLPIKINN